MPTAHDRVPVESPSPRAGEPASGQPPVGPSDGSTLSRRRVVRVLGTGGAAVLVGVGGYRVFDTAAVNPGHGQAYEPWRHWRDDAGPMGAVAAALLAANPHNTQPWLFRVNATAIVVDVDPGRHIGSVDPYRREQHVGLGCALENLALACRARGLRPDIAVLPDGPDARRVAHVDLTPAPAQQDDRYEAIGHRHTNRGPYRALAIPAEALAELVDTAGLPGISVQWIVDPASMLFSARSWSMPRKRSSPTRASPATASPGSVAPMTPSSRTATDSPSTRKG